MPLLLPSQRTEAWHQARAGKLSSSTAAAALGICPYCSRQKAWRIITGQQVEEWNPHMVRGATMEAGARLAYEVDSGLLVAQTGLWVHPAHEWLLASPDGLVGPDGLLEIKCPHDQHQSVPEHYLVQIAVQLAVTDREWCDFYSWSYGVGKIVRVFRELDKEEKLIEDLRRFYLDHVVAMVIPPRKKPTRRKNGSHPIQHETQNGDAGPRDGGDVPRKEPPQAEKQEGLED